MRRKLCPYKGGLIKTRSAGDSHSFISRLNSNSSSKGKGAQDEDPTLTNKLKESLADLHELKTKKKITGVGTTEDPDDLGKSSFFFIHFC